MFKPTYTVAIPEGSKFRVEKGVREVWIRQGGRKTGRMAWVPVNKAGRAVLTGKTWYGRLRKANGRIETVKLLDNREAAEALLREKQAHENDVRTGRALPVKKSSETVAELINRYEMEKRMEGLTERYILTTWPRLREAAADLGWKTVEDVRHVEANDISRWFTGITKGVIGTKIKRLIIVKQFMTWLLDQELIFRVPKFPRVSDRVTFHRRAFTPEEVELLAENSPWPRSILYRLAFATLARKGAMLALVAADLDLADPKNPTVFLSPRKSKTKRGQRLPVPTKLVPDLQRLVKQAKGRPLFWKVAGLNMSNTFKADLKRAGMPERTEDGHAVFHSLRHSGATHLAKSGVNLLLIKEMGGWTSLKMLAKHYAHLSPMADRAAIDAVMNQPVEPPEKLKIFRQS